jgi:RNA polymerase sigma-70 factor (sigma-E family)
MDPASEAQFVPFARAHWRDLVRAAIFLGASAHEADDLAQQTLIRCYTSWENVQSADKREAYVYRMLLNQLRDTRRSRWWKQRSWISVDDAHRDASAPDGSESLAISDAVERALGVLPKAQREVVVLRYFVQLSEAQTASTLGIAPGTVKSRLSRALTQLAASSHLADLAQEPR